MMICLEKSPVAKKIVDTKTEAPKADVKVEAKTKAPKKVAEKK